MTCLLPLLLLLAPAHAAEPDAAASAAIQLDEKELAYYAKQFKTKCARCHGERGDGAGSQAGEEGVRPADFTDVAFMRGRSDEQLRYQIERGGEEVSAMPAFGPSSDHGWSADKIAHMVAFLRTLTPEGSPPAEAGPAEAPPPAPAAIVPHAVKAGLAYYAAEDGVLGLTRGLREERNLEEVYRNYSYFEATYDEAGRVVEFIEYKQGEVVLTETYTWVDGVHTQTKRERPGAEPEIIQH